MRRQRLTLSLLSVLACFTTGTTAGIFQLRPQFEILNHQLISHHRVAVYTRSQNDCTPEFIFCASKRIYKCASNDNRPPAS